MKKIFLKSILIFTIVSTIGIFSCNTTTHFDQVAYTQITSVESDALSLMDKATEDYSTHKKEIDDVSNKIQKAYLYDKNRPKNKKTEEMWNLIIDPDGHLYGGFLARWKADAKLTTAFISEAKKKMQANFARLEQLENKKIK